MRSVSGTGRRSLGVAFLSCASLLPVAVACNSKGSGGAPPSTMEAPVMGAGVAAPPPVAGAAGPVEGTSGAGAGGAVATAGSVAPPDGTAGDSAPAAGASGAPEAGTTGAMPGDTDWRMIGYDLGSTYFNSAETVLTKENAASLEEAWTVDMGGNVYGAPLQVGDKIYATGPGTVRAFDAESGDPLWSVNVGSTGSLAYAGGTLYLNANTAQVVALDAADGAQLWTKAPDSQRADGSSSAVVVGDYVLVGGSNGGLELSTGAFRGYLSALDRMTGEVAWTTHTVPTGAKGASIWSSVSADLASNRVYASTGNNYGAPATDTSDAIIAFDLATGEILWKNQRVENDTFGGFGGGGPDYDFGANPVLYETMVDGVMTQLVSAGAKSGAAHAVRRDDGMLVWTRSLCTGTADGSRGIFVNSTWTGKYMLFACNEASSATLYALDGATGDVAWMRTLPGLVWGRMSVANGVGFVGTGTTLEVFDVDTGMVLKSVPSKGGTVAGTITIANGRVAFGEGLSWSSGVRGSTLTVLTVR
jgi:outer membrane protein assembly factor BamB